MKRLGVVVAVVCALLVATQAWAAALSVVTDENLPPYSFVRGGEVVGIDVDMLNEAARRLDVELHIRARPWNRALEECRTGEAQFAMPLFLTPQRAAFATFVAPVHYSTLGVFVAKGREFAFSGIADLAGKRIGVNRGFAISEEIDQTMRDGTIVVEEVASTDLNIQKLLLGRIDAFVANVINTRHFLKGLPDPGRVVLLPKAYSERRPAYLVASNAAAISDRERTTTALRAVLESLHADGTYERIVAKYTH